MAQSARYSNALAYRPYGPTPGVYGNAAPSNSLAAMMAGYTPQAVGSMMPAAGQQAPAQAAAAPAQAMQQAAPQQAMAPQQAAPPISMGGQQFTNMDGGQAGSDSSGMGNDMSSGMGPNPGDLNGLGLTGSMGGLFGAIGGLAGPIGGLLGSGIGTAVDVGTVNDALSRNGITEQVGLMDSLGLLGSNMLGGSLMGVGTTAEDLFSDIAGRNMSVNPDLEGQMAQAAMAGVTPAMDPGGNGYADMSPIGIGMAALDGVPSFGGMALAGMQGPEFGGIGDTGNPDGGYADSAGAGGFGPDGEGSGGLGAGNDGNGWWTGGYTGAGQDGRIDPFAPAGTVHEGEIVIPANMVQRYGQDRLMGYVEGTNALAQGARSTPKRRESRPSSSGATVPEGGGWVTGSDVRKAWGKSQRGDGS